MMKHVSDFPVQIPIASLEKGMKVRLGEETIATVKALKDCNGCNGTEMILIACNRTAVAIEISFEDHEPILAHPDHRATLA